MSRRTPAAFCTDISVGWRLIAWTPTPAMKFSDIRRRIECFERFTVKHGQIRYLSYAATPLGKLAPSLPDQTRLAVDIALLGRAISSKDRASMFDAFIARYFHFAWMTDPFEVGEFSHLLGHYVHEEGWRVRSKGGPYSKCRLQKLPRPSSSFATELLALLSLDEVPPDTSETLFLYLQYQTAMDELALR